jgi:hypothetical protein
LIGDAEAFHVRYWNAPLLDKPRWVPVVSFGWSEVRRIDVSGTNVTRMNVPAIALFGVLGLAMGKAPGTHIAVSAGTTDALFASEEPVAKLRPIMERLVPDAYRHALLRFDGHPTNDAGADRGADRGADPAERLVRLTRLHADGVITDEELAARRAAIVAEL